MKNTIKGLKNSALALAGILLASTSVADHSQYHKIEYPKNRHEITLPSRESLEKVIGEIETPEQALEYLSKFKVLAEGGDDKLYGRKDFWASLLYFVANQAGDCEDFAIAAATLLEDDGYKPTLVAMHDAEKILPDHVVVILEKDGNYRFLTAGNAQRPKMYLSEEHSNKEEIFDLWQKKVGYDIFFSLDITKDQDGTKLKDWQFLPYNRKFTSKIFSVRDKTLN